MRIILTLIFCLGICNYAISSDSTFIKYGNTLHRDIVEKINNRDAGSERIIRLSYNEKYMEGDEERVLGLYRRESDEKTWNQDNMAVAKTYLKKFKENSDIDFYVVLASVYKYFDVNDDPNNVYTYQKLNAQKKLQQQEINELKLKEDLERNRAYDSAGSSRKFLAFADKVSKKYSGRFENTANGRKVFVLIVISSFYPNEKDGAVGKVLHSFGVMHDRFNYNGYEYEEFAGMFLGTRIDFNLGVVNKEEKLGEYIRLMYQIKMGEVIPENGTYKKLGYSIPKKEILPGSYIQQLKDKIGNPHNYKPHPQQPNDINPNFFDYTGAVTPEEINNALEVFQQVKTDRGYVLKVFVTDYETPYNILKIIDDYVKNPGEYDMIIWLHFNKFVDPVFDFFYGKKVPNQEELNWLQQFIVQLMGGSGMQVNLLTMILDGLAHLIGELNIPARFYDPESKDEKTKKDNFNPVPSGLFNIITLKVGVPPIRLALQSIPGLQPMEDPYQPYKCEFAFYCGIANGVVDVLKGVPEFSSFLIKLLTNEKGKEKGARTEFLEGWKAMKANGIWKSIWQMTVNAHTGNACKVSAQIGHDVIDVVSVAIAFSKAGVAAKIATFLEVIDPTTYAINFTTKALLKLPRVVIATVDYTKEFIFKLGSGFIRLHVIDGKEIIQIAHDGLQQWRIPNWNDYPPLAMAGPGGVNYNVIADPLNNVAEDGEYIVKIVEDVTGGPLGDANNTATAITSKGRGVLVKDATIKFVTEELKNLKNNHPDLFNYLDALRGTTNEKDNLLQAFIKDCQKKNLLDRFEAGLTNPEELQMDAWLVLYNAGRGGLRSDEAILLKLADLLRDNKFAGEGASWGKADFEKLFSNHAELGRSENIVDEFGEKLSVSRSTLSGEALLDVLILARKEPKPGIEEVLKRLAGNDRKYLIGTEWQLRYAKSIWNDIARFEFKFPPEATASFRIIDIYLKNGTRVEVKSWDDFLTSYVPNFVEQFCKDLRDAPSLEHIQWIFDTKGKFAIGGDNMGIAYLHSIVITALREENSKKIMKEILSEDRLEALFRTKDIDKAIDFLQKESEFLKMFKLAK